MAATIDHIIPVSLGGTNHLENLQAAHQDCNNRRGQQDASRLMANVIIQCDHCPERVGALNMKKHIFEVHLGRPYKERIWRPVTKSYGAYIHPGSSIGRTLDC